MEHSDQLNAIGEAMAKAQAEIEGAAKGNTNPAFRSKYADLGAVWEAIREPLSKHGIAVMQFPRSVDNGVEVETLLLHSSGQWIKGAFWIPVTKPDAHGFMSAATYARRGGLSAATGVAPVDDDGNGATGRRDDGASDTAQRAVQTPPRSQAPAPAARPATINMAPTAAMQGSQLDAHGAALQWTEDSIVAVRGLKTAKALETWWQNNLKFIKRLEDRELALYERFVDAFETQRNDIADVTRAG